MGRHQHDINDLARMERICLDLAEESRVPREAGALREMAENYGREAAKLIVARTVDCPRRERKKTSDFSKVDKTPLVPNAPRRPALCRQPQGCCRGSLSALISFGRKAYQLETL